MSCCPSHTDEYEPSVNHKHEDSGNNNHDMNRGTNGMESLMAQQFLKSFYIVTVLLIPLIIVSKGGIFVPGIENFELRKYFQFAIAAVIFYYSLVFFEHAKHEIKKRKYGMMTLVSLAVGAGFIFSAASTFIPALKGVEFYLEISTLIWILLFGHYLEAKSSSAAGNALQEVAKLLPKKAHLKIGGEINDVDVDKLKEGDIVVVKPGEKVPADGIILSGKANMNEALISGESKPISKGEGVNVVAGSICLDGVLEIKLNRVGENSTIGQIQNLISKAQKTKPTAQKIADKAARFLTFSALGVSIITLLIWSLVLGKPFVFSITLAITVLVIACPHALGLAIPAVTTIATTLATKNGIFIKNLAKLEIVRAIDYIIFDKTGTLTKGEFGVTNIHSLESEKEKDIISISASLEQSSSHVIGISIVNFAKDKKIGLSKVQEFKNFSGKGIQGKVEGKEYLLGNKSFMEDRKVWNKKANEIYKKLLEEAKTVVFLSSKNKIEGVLALSDQIKPESYKAIKSLHKLRIKVGMLTGDNEQVASEVAKKLSIDSFFSEVKPEDKYTYIKKLQQKGNKVMMVGDGVNDAPALTQADIGVAIGAGTDVSVEAGDIVLTRSNPEDIAHLTILSRKVYRKMQENLVWAVGYNVIAIPAAAGLFSHWGILLRPEFGAILMTLSSVIVVINAMSLKKVNLSV